MQRKPKSKIILQTTCALYSYKRPHHPVRTGVGSAEGLELEGPKLGVTRINSKGTGKNVAAVSGCFTPHLKQPCFKLHPIQTCPWLNFWENLFEQTNWMTDIWYLVK